MPQKMFFLTPFCEVNTVFWDKLKSDLQLVLFAVDDDCSDLLVHKDEDGAEQSRKCSHQQRPPGIFSQRVHQPSSVL